MDIKQEELKRQYLFKQQAKIKSDANYELNTIIPLLMEEELIDIKPITQQVIELSTGTIRIDLLYPSIQLAIEIDEDHHMNRIDLDTKRDEELKNRFGITTHRIRFWGEHKEEPIWRKTSNCLSLIKDQIERTQPDKWHMAQHTLEAAKNDCTNMIFCKINDPLFKDGMIDFNAKINQSIIENPRSSELNFAIYTGSTSEIATVISVPVENLQRLSRGNYRINYGCYQNDKHPLNFSGFTSSNWPVGKSTFYSNDLTSLIP